MNHETTEFARWRWAPRTSQSTAERAYALQQLSKHESEAWIVIGAVLGALAAVMLGAHLLARWLA